MKHTPFAAGWQQSKSARVREPKSVMAVTPAAERIDPEVSAAACLRSDLAGLSIYIASRRDGNYCRPEESWASMFVLMLKRLAPANQVAGASLLLLYSFPRPPIALQWMAHRVVEFC